jgi:hypothetical protein
MPYVRLIRQTAKYTFSEGTGAAKGFYHFTATESLHTRPGKRGQEGEMQGEFLKSLGAEEFDAYCDDLFENPTDRLIQSLQETHRALGVAIESLSKSYLYARRHYADDRVYQRAQDTQDRLIRALRCMQDDIVKEAMYIGRAIQFE